MKLCRIGNVGNEKPALIDNENNYRDLSSLLDDLNLDNNNINESIKVGSVLISTSAIPQSLSFKSDIQTICA